MYAKEEACPWVNQCGNGMIDGQELDDLGQNSSKKGWKTETKEREGKHLETAKW